MSPMVRHRRQIHRPGNDVKMHQSVITAARYNRRVITGVHAIVYSPDAEKVRTFFADMLEMSSVDAGEGWPIFALPPAELAVHPAGDSDGSRHELYLMCDDIHATLA